jgi:hypothetical protein
VIAYPRASTTEAGIGTRFDAMRTTSDDSISSLACLVSVVLFGGGEDEEPETTRGRFGSAIGLGVGLGAVLS